MMNRMLEFMGNGTFIALTANTSLYRGAPRVQVLTPDANGYTVELPDTAQLKKGGPHFYIINTSDTFTFDVESPNGFDLFSLGTEEGIVLGAFKNDGQERWFGKIFGLTNTTAGELAP